MAGAPSLCLLWLRYWIQFWIQATEVIDLLRTCDALMNICETATCYVQTAKSSLNLWCEKWGWTEFEFWIWIWSRSRVIDEFELDFCKINEFEFSFFKVYEFAFEFKIKKKMNRSNPANLRHSAIHRGVEMKAKKKVFASGKLRFIAELRLRPKRKGLHSEKPTVKWNQKFRGKRANLTWTLKKASKKVWQSSTYGTLVFCPSNSMERKV